MKRIITLTVLMTAFVVNTMAYDRKIVERHSFRLLHPEDYELYTSNDQQGKQPPTITWDNNHINTIQQQYNYNQTTTQVSYKSWLYNEYRFLCEPTSNPTAYNLDISKVNADSIPEGWRCVQENDEVHEYANAYSLGARVFTNFANNGRGLFWRVKSAEYGSQNSYPLSLFRGSYTLTFAVARRGGTQNGYTVSVINKNTGQVVRTQNYENPTTISGDNNNVDLNTINQETIEFNIAEAGNYIIRFSVLQNNNQNSEWDGYILAKCQLTRSGDSWLITKNARADKGYGLVNVSGSYKGLKILRLKAGDIVRFSYFLNSTASSVPMPYFKASNGHITGRHQSWSQSQEANLAEGTVINGSFDIYVDSDGDLDINCPSGILIREVTITLAEYKRANYIIEPVAGTPGYKYTITGPGVLEEKRGAVPYITMRFGNDNDMTIVKNFGNGNYAASCIVDPSNDLDIEHSNVRLNAIYKRRYQNESGQFVAFTEPLTEDTSTPANSTYNQIGDATEQDRVKLLAKEEVNSLKGREWTVFEATNTWNADADWITARSRCYKWGDDFNSIYPLYGTYFYFFPEVKGKLSVKFYCEGGGEHMAFWYKQDRDGNFIPVGNGQPNNGHNNTLNENIYEYKNIQLERGGVYYLCSNPTLIAREHPVVRLISYEFIPEFNVQPLYKVVKNGTDIVSEACEIQGGPFNDLTVDKSRTIQVNGESAPEVKFLGNITDADFSITKDENDKQYLNVSNIKYKTGDDVNKGGVICVKLHCDAGEATFVLTVAYEAAQARIDGNGNRTGTMTAVKKWDFFSGKSEWDLGKYGGDDGTRYATNQSAWTAKSRLYKEVHKADGLTTDWVLDYLDRSDPSHPTDSIFKSVYDMEGDNADMIHETEGLIFLTESNMMGIYNEEAPSTPNAFHDRFIGFFGDTHLSLEDGHHRSLIIPLLKKGDRIVIKMGRYGNCDEGKPVAHLWIEGANDAINNPITGEYIIGGSHELESGDKSKPYGEYHFIATGTEDTSAPNYPYKDFEMKVDDAKLLKVYSIEIYRNADNDNADILTENSINMTGVNGHEILYNGTSTPINFNLQYSGLTESSADLTSNKAVSSHRTGSFMSTPPTFESSDNTFTYTPAANQFGLFRARLGVMTKTLGRDVTTYVTDYADYDMAVGYLEKKDYPYTWDFTDLKKYAKAGGDLNNDGSEKLAEGVDNNLSIWNGYGLNVKTTGANPETTFVSGGQLYAGDGMFAESKGIGIVPTNSSTANVINLGTSDENGGMIISNADLTIPQVAAGNAIYVRAHKDNENAATPTYNSNQAFVSRTTTDGSGDEIFAMQMADNAATADVTLHFNGYTVRKVAVSDAPKKVNKYGWTSESREHVIDPELTSYMTGVNFSTYLVTDVDYENYKVTLTAIDNDHLMPAANADGSENACLIHNHAGEEVKILNDGFHLFVPDMHKTSPAETSSSKLKAQLNEGTVDEITGDYTNFAFTYLYYDTSDGSIPDNAELEDGGQAFYHIASDGAASLGHQGYLPLLTSALPADVVNGGRGFALTFGNGDITAVEATRNVAPKTDVYYNLSGQQLDGKPSQRGLYIVNGKKMYVK